MLHFQMANYSFVAYWIVILSMARDRCCHAYLNLTPTITMSFKHCHDVEAEDPNVLRLVEELEVMNRKNEHDISWCFQKPIIIPAETNCSASIIFLHGLGDYGINLYPIIMNIRQPHMRLVIPTSRIMPFTLARGMVHFAWYDLKHKHHKYGQEDTIGIKRASRYVHYLIENEIKHGTPSERIIVGGLAQGGALALHSALTFPKKLAGVVAFSSWFPENGTFLKQSINTLNKDIPILKCDHRSPEPFLENQKYKSYSSFKYPLSISDLQQIKEFFKSQLPQLNASSQFSHSFCQSEEQQSDKHNISTSLYSNYTHRSLQHDHNNHQIK